MEEGDCFVDYILTPETLNMDSAGNELVSSIGDPGLADKLFIFV